METLATSQVPPLAQDKEGDGIMMVQSFVKLHDKASRHLADLQQTLDHEGHRRRSEVRFLKMMLENRYRGVVNWEHFGHNAQALQALLVTHEDHGDVC